MQSAQIIIINGTLREIGAFLLLSRRAHLLTTAKTRRVLAVTFRAVACSSTAFSFYEKETKILPERCDLQEWRSII